MKVVTIVGARPNFIKAVMVTRAIEKNNRQSHEKIQEILVHTGQHYHQNLSAVFFDELHIRDPSYQLGIGSSTHGKQTGRMMAAIEKVLMKEHPDWVLVYGDTNSTLAGSLAAAKLHIPVGHVEAGLRSKNMEMPEEINRILTDRVSKLLFCPTDLSVENLRREGLESDDCRIVKTGDVMYDAALFFGDMAKRHSKVLKKLSLNDEYVLCTVHRQENTDNTTRLRSIIEALNKVHKEIQIVLPIHPRTRRMLEGKRISFSFKCVEPVSYLEMLMLLKNCRLVVTDSGGLQKEAFFFRKHCITLRDETEWMELADHGFNRVVGADSSKIMNGFYDMMGATSSFDVELYGDGKASELIVKELAQN